MNIFAAQAKRPRGSAAAVPGDPAEEPVDDGQDISLLKFSISLNSVKIPRSR